MASATPAAAKFFYRVKNWNVRAHLGGKLLGPPRNRIAKRGERAIPGLPRQLMNVKGMDTPHAAQAGNSKFDRSVHSLPHGGILVRGKFVARCTAKRPDCILYYPPKS